jgi:hypothetical protein
MKNTEVHSCTPNAPSPPKKNSCSKGFTCGTLHKKKYKTIGAKQKPAEVTERTTYSIMSLERTSIQGKTKHFHHDKDNIAL